MGYCGKLPMGIYPLSLQNSMNCSLMSCTAIYFFMENERLGEYMKIYFNIFFAFPIAIIILI